MEEGVVGVRGAERETDCRYRGRVGKEQKVVDERVSKQVKEMEEIDDT